MVQVQLVGGSLDIAIVVHGNVGDQLSHAEPTSAAVFWSICSPWVTVRAVVSFSVIFILSYYRILSVYHESEHASV